MVYNNKKRGFGAKRSSHYWRITSWNHNFIWFWGEFFVSSFVLSLQMSQNCLWLCFKYQWPQQSLVYVCNSTTGEGPTSGKSNRNSFHKAKLCPAPRLVLSPALGWPGQPPGSPATIFLQNTLHSQLLNARLLASSKAARHNADFAEPDIHKLPSARTAHRGCRKHRVARKTEKSKVKQQKRREKRRKEKNLSHGASELLLYTIRSAWDTSTELPWL